MWGAFRDMSSICGGRLIRGRLAAGPTGGGPGVLHAMVFIWGARLSGGGLAAGPTGGGAVPEVVLTGGSQPLLGVCGWNMPFSLGLTGCVLRTDATGWKMRHDTLNMHGIMYR